MKKFGGWHKFRKRKIEGKKFLDVIKVYIFCERIIVEVENYELTPKREFMKELGVASFSFSIKEIDVFIKNLKKAKEALEDWEKESLK
jgi:hypothetical protein